MRLVVEDIAGDDQAQAGDVVPASGVGETGLAVSWPGKNQPQTCMYPGEICQLQPLLFSDETGGTMLTRGTAAGVSAC